MNNKLAYFVSKSSMFAIGYFLLFKDNGKNAWISIVLGSLLGIGVIFIYYLIKKKLKTNELVVKLKKSFLGKVYIVIFIFFYILLIIINLLVLTMFVNSFYLLNTPKLFVIIPFVLLSFYLVYKQEYVLSSLANLLFFASIAIIITFSLLLIPYCDTSQLLPLFNYNITNILKGSIIYASLTSIPQILIIDYYQKFKDVFKNYLVACFFNLIIALGTILALGNTLLKIYSFPEYDVLKQIKILDFIENIENISAFGWYCELFIMLTIIINNLKKSLPKKGNKIWLSLLLVIIVYVASYIIGGNYIVTLKLFYLYPYILIGFLIIFLTLLLYLKLKKNDT